MTGPTVNANRNLLPDNWWLDERFRSEVHEKVHRMKRQGFSNLEIARQTGVSARGVQRIVHRRSVEQFRCGAPRVEARGRHGMQCTMIVKNEGDRCYNHQES